MTRRKKNMAYNYLPGLDVSIRDGGLVVPRPEFQTGSLLIIGPQSAVSAKEQGVTPIRVGNQDTFESEFGKALEGNPLFLAWKQAIDAGCKDIRLLELCGTDADKQYKNLHKIYQYLEDYLVDGVALTGIYGDETIVSPGLTSEDTDYAASIVLAKQLYTPTTDEEIGEGNGVTDVFYLGDSPVVQSDMVVKKLVGAVRAEWSTGAITPLEDNNSATITFKGVTVSISTSDTAVAAQATSETAGNVVVLNGSDADTHAVAIVDVFATIAAEYPESPISDFAFVALGGSGQIEISAPLREGASHNLESITGSLVIANDTIETQLQTSGADGEILVVLDDEYTLDSNGGAITFKDTNLPSTGEVVYASYKHYSFNVAAQLAGFCEIVSARVSQTLGFVALKPAADTDLATIKGYINGLGTQEFNGYLQVKAGPEAFFSMPDGTRYSDSGIVAYAAQSVMLPAQSSPTNKTLPGASGLVYNLSPAQLDELCGENIVTFRIKSGNVVVTDGVTTAGQGSDFTRLTTMRITNDAVESVRTVADPFIGEPNNTPQRAALNTAIRSALDAMVTAGALRTFRFSINSTLEEFINGKMQVDLELVPAFELRKITISVALRPSL